jgi:hypothetical protein
MADPVLVRVQSSRLDKALKQSSELMEAGRGSDFDNEHVRRPFRGIQIQNDTYATIEVVYESRNDLFVRSLVDSGARPASAESQGRGHGTRISNFVIQSLNTTRTEKMQIIETFGEDFVFFFGERPIQVTGTGVLLKTADFGWRNEFLLNYEANLRGTKLVENKARMLLAYDGILLSGYLTQLAVSESSQSPYHVTMNFGMLVLSMHLPPTTGSTVFPKASFRGDNRVVIDDLPNIALQRLREENSQGTSARTLHDFLDSTSLMSNLKSIKAGVRNALRKVQEIRMGQMEQVPAGAVASEIHTADIQFAAGSITSEQHRHFMKNVLNRSVPMAMTPEPGNKAHRGHFYDNYDEYIRKPPTTAGRTALTKRDMRQLTLAAATARVDDILNEHPLLSQRGGDDALRNDILLQAASAGFAFVGDPVLQSVTNSGNENVRDWARKRSKRSPAGSAGIGGAFGLADRVL